MFTNFSNGSAPNAIIHEQNYIDCTCISSIIYKTIQKLTQRNGPVQPISFHEAITRYFPIPNKQEDALELLNHIISDIHNTRNCCKANSIGTIWSNNFSGKIKITIECMKCKHSHITHDIFTYLIINPDESIQNSLENYFTNEVISHFKCDKCNTIGDAIKEITLELLPKILCIQITRISKTLEKNNTIINISKRISLKNFINTTNSTATRMLESYAAKISIWV